MRRSLWCGLPARAVVLLPLIAFSALALLGCSAEPTPAEQVRDEVISWIEQAPTRVTDHFLYEYFYTEGGRRVFRTLPADSPYPQGGSGFDQVFRQGDDYTVNFGKGTGPGAKWVDLTVREVAKTFKGADEKTKILLLYPAAAIIFSRANDPLHLLTVMDVDDGIEESGVNRVITGSVSREARWGNDLPTELVEAVVRDRYGPTTVRLLVGPGGEALSLVVDSEPPREYGFGRGSQDLAVPDGMGLEEWLLEMRPNVHFWEPPSG
ncbi:MAG: hypothetical protein ACYCX3_07140 [Thermoleophilia bacterium]